MCLDCKYQTSYGYLWFAICDGREHVLTSEHKQVTITEIIWQNDKVTRNSQNRNKILSRAVVLDIICLIK